MFWRSRRARWQQPPTKHIKRTRVCSTHPPHLPKRYALNAQFGPTGFPKGGRGDGCRCCTNNCNQCHDARTLNMAVNVACIVVVNVIA
eukprot:2322120-Lingulodinium_polyedra.AAC.1